ncbi:lipid droplet-regulating VLDL assembly factor AUP1 isoform X2 [Caloenas nicobarica]|uniref:lipid droplet-regulating VLDL assembly factor AUP1 isoform X2 n=1 Tax=Caloenas nicobarica TaxID=187106 RepID=UPI0032B74899
MEPPGPGPERLFDSHRFPTDGFLLLALLLYAPVGLCLLVLRLFIGAHVFLVSCALPDSVLRRFIVRVMCSVLGLFVRQSDPRLRDASVRVYIANHVTQFDHNVINLLTSCNTPALNAAPGFLCWSRGFLELGAGSRAEELVHSLKAYSSHQANPPLLLFPEEAATNGRAGLLHFSSWPFSVADVVQPVALHVQRPLVTVSVADSSWITELLWTFFAPFTVYQVRWLPSVSRRAEEPSEDFALRVQEATLKCTTEALQKSVPRALALAVAPRRPVPLTPRETGPPGPRVLRVLYMWLFAFLQLLAVELGVVSTRLTAADKAEHMKRLRHTSLLPFAPGSSQPLAARLRVPSGLGAAEDMRIVAMAQRVKEVLPHVPLEVIRTDLARTSCVDTTIANLLEGSVPFCPESGEDSADLPAPAPSPPAAAPSAQGSAAAPAQPAPKQFAKSPVERHLSLQERKRALYDYARRALLALGSPAWEDAGAGQASEQPGQSELPPPGSQPQPGWPHTRQQDVPEEAERREQRLPASLTGTCARHPLHLSPKEFAFVCSPQPVLWSLQGGTVGRKKRLFSSELLLLFIPSLLLSHLLTLGLGIYIGKRLAASSTNPL